MRRGGYALRKCDPDLASRSVKRFLLLLVAACGLVGCAGNPLETSNLTQDGRIYRESEPTETGEARTTVKVRGATF